MAALLFTGQMMEQHTSDLGHPDWKMLLIQDEDAQDPGTPKDILPVLLLPAAASFT